MSYIIYLDALVLHLGGNIFPELWVSTLGNSNRHLNTSNTKPDLDCWGDKVEEGDISFPSLAMSRIALFVWIAELLSSSLLRANWLTGILLIPACSLRDGCNWINVHSNSNNPIRTLSSGPWSCFYIISISERSVKIDPMGLMMITTSIVFELLR